MHESRASETEVSLPELLSKVEQGETVVITREGRPIARLVPEPTGPRRSRAEVLREIEAFRKTMPRVTVEEILAWRHEGHKY